MPNHGGNEPKSEHLDQNPRLPIRIVSPAFGHLPQDESSEQAAAQRLPYYFLLFVIAGTFNQQVDLETYELRPLELLFLLPHQVRVLCPAVHSTDYFKLGFDDECLSRLPRQYPFLLNPLNQQKLRFTPQVGGRLEAIFGILQALLTSPETDPEIILAHLNSLLTEINSAYFSSGHIPADDRMSRFIGFKIFVEDHLTEHPSIESIAAALAMSTDSLYQIVKQYSGQSPKEFMTHRLILEARRRLRYGQRSSVKELAYELGFNDPDYFSRLFKKVTCKTVASFFQDLS